MARLRLNQHTQSRFIEVLQRLHPDARPIWGTMNAAQMSAHVAQTLRASLGEVPVQDRSNWLTRNVLVHAFEILPMPKNFRGPAEFFPSETGTFDHERSITIDAIGRFVERSAREPNAIGISPLMGPMPLSTWQRIHALHLQHHLKQFGVWRG